MSKTDPSILRSTVKKELITYLSAGKINKEQYLQALDYRGLNIENFDQLKKLHFVLASDVVEYIERIPEWIRRVKTVTREQTETVRGEVTGSVDWRQTQQTRAKAGYDDPTLFVVRDAEIAYDIPENRVVKKLLAAIAEPLTSDIEPVEYEWRSMWDDQDIIELQQLLAHNLYLDALPDPEDITLVERDLSTARQSRHRLYTESYRLYRIYDDLLNDRFNEDGVQELLSETLITPPADYKLFELFCLFGMIRRLQNQYPNLSLRRVDTETDAVAYLQDETQRLEVYYDQSGPLRFFEAYPSTEELAARDVPQMVQRHAAALERHERAIDEFLGAGSNRSFFNGRPDFLVLQYKTDDEDARDMLTDAIIGEVKYTQSVSTFSSGLRELQEYLHFARENENYLFSNETSRVEVTGILCTDGVETEIKKAESILHLTTDEIMEFWTNLTTHP